MTQPDPDLAKVWLGWPIPPGKSQTGGRRQRKALAQKRSHQSVGRSSTRRVCVGVIDGRSFGGWEWGRENMRLWLGRLSEAASVCWGQGGVVVCRARENGKGSSENRLGGSVTLWASGLKKRREKGRSVGRPEMGHRIFFLRNCAGIPLAE